MDYRIIYVGAQTIFGILFLTLLFLRHYGDRGKQADKLDAVYCLFIVTVVLDSLWMLIDGKPEYRSWHVALQVVYLSAMSLTGYLWFLYTLDSLPAHSMKIRKYRFVLGIPVLIEIVLILCSVKTQWVFVVGADGTYARGDWHIYSILLNYAYMVLGSMVALRCRREALLTMDKRRYGVAALFPVPVLVFSAAQLLLPPGLPAMQGGVLVALLLLYGTSQNVRITRDHLTGLPNRFAFEQDLLERIGRYRSGGAMRLYLLEGDLDKFKKINDSFGHPAGDRALLHASKALSQAFSELGAAVFRVGGDEFMMIVEVEDPVDLEWLRTRIAKAVAQTAEPDDIELGISLGMVEYDAGMDFRALIEAVDRHLYEDKKAHTMQP